MRDELAAQDEYDPWLIVVGRATEDGPRASAVVLSTSGDAEQVAVLLRELGHRPLTYRVADGATG